jgi:hypothetical protein
MTYRLMTSPVLPAARTKTALRANIARLRYQILAKPVDANYRDYQKWLGDISATPAVSARPCQRNRSLQGRSALSGPASGLSTGRLHEMLKRPIGLRLSAISYEQLSKPPPVAKPAHFGHRTPKPRPPCRGQGRFLTPP